VGIGLCHNLQHLLSYRVKQRLTRQKALNFGDHRISLPDPGLPGCASHMRGHNHILQRKKRMVGRQRLFIEHIKGRLDPAAAKFGQESFLIDQVRPSGIDKDSAIL